VYGFRYRDEAPDPSIADNLPMPDPPKVEPGKPPILPPDVKSFDMLPVSVQAFVRKAQGKE
jgi:hypothetical protein